MTAAGQAGERLVSDIAGGLYRILINYEREGGGPGSRFEGQTVEVAQAAWAVRQVDQRWTSELTAQADRYASVGTEIADAMAEALRTAVRIMHRG